MSNKIYIRKIVKTFILDTAFNYNTEESIGKVIKKWISLGKGTRQDLFITTKLPNNGNRAADVDKFLNMSLEKLQMSYVDLYLIHMPFAFACNEQTFTPQTNEDGSFILDTESDITITWAVILYYIHKTIIYYVQFQVMEEQVEKGLTKAIGLSNFNCEQLRRIYENAKIKPSVLQVELHAYLQQTELRKICKEWQIAVTAYSPLGSPGANKHFTSKYNYS